LRDRRHSSRYAIISVWANEMAYLACEPVRGMPESVYRALERLIEGSVDDSLWDALADGG